MQVAQLEERKVARDGARVREKLEALVAAAKTDANLIEPMLEAARAEATLGEICGALKELWGEYREPAAF